MPHIKNKKIIEKTETCVDYPIGAESEESETDDQVLRITNPNGKTANLQAIKKACQRKSEKEKHQLILRP